MSPLFGSAGIAEEAWEGGPPPTPGPSCGPWGLATRTYSGVRNLLHDPRVMGVLRAGPRVGLFLARGNRRTASAGPDDRVVPVRPTPSLALQAYLDEVLIAVFRHPDLLPRATDYAPAAADLAGIRDLFSTRGWLERPAEYHQEPPMPDDIRAWHGRAAGLGYEHVTFTSGWEPDPEEPGRSRWLSHEANRTVHALVSRTPGREHPSWLVCAHGFGMGTSASMDLRAFRTRQLHSRGINVVVPVLPLHGPRASGRIRGEDLMTIDLVDSMHGMAQATWDLRRIIRWLRESQGAETVGLIGYSLGALVAALVAATEDDVACVIAGVPVVDLPELYRRHSPPDIARLADAHGVLGEAADDAHRVVSPLAMDCKVPVEHRYVFSGLADRMSTFGQARKLWLHWGQPPFAAYPGGHVGFFFSGIVRQFVDDAVTSSFPAASGHPGQPPNVPACREPGRKG
jgi:dienelactone hydrolase